MNINPPRYLYQTAPNIQFFNALQAICNPVSIGISLVRDGEAHVILKGKVDTTTLMKGVLSKESGLRTGRLLSDVFIFEYPEKNSESKFILMSDGGVVLNPTL